MKTKDFKGQNVPWRPNIWRKSKKNIIRKLIYWNNALNLFYKISPYSSNFWPSWYILAFKILGLHLSPLLWVRGALKSSLGYYKSISRTKNNCLCKKAAPAISAAFLTLKLENKENRAYRKSLKETCRSYCFLKASSAGLIQRQVSFEGGSL